METDRKSGAQRHITDDEWDASPAALANGYLEHVCAVFQLAVMTSHRAGDSIDEWKLSFRNFAFRSDIAKYCVAALRSAKSTFMTSTDKSVLGFRRDVHAIMDDDSRKWTKASIQQLFEEVKIGCVTKLYFFNFASFPLVRSLKAMQSQSTSA